MQDTVRVSQLVIRSEFDGGERYLLARRTMDETWEFIGGKLEPGETTREAGLRELDEELQSIRPGDVEILDVAETYASSYGDRFELTPLLVELPASEAADLDDGDLSDEHDALAWIDARDLEDYETLGQRPALEKLGILSTK